MREWRARSAQVIGSRAKALLAAPGQGRVVGVTSRGLFINLASNWVVFISSEGYHGPLTINLGQGVSVGEQIANGIPARVGAGEILLPEARLVIHTDRAEVWRLPDRPPVKFNRLQTMERLTEVTDLALASHRKSEFNLLLPAIPGGEDRVGESVSDFLRAVQDLRRIFHNREAGEMAKILGSLLGRGSGLTPSGDDLAIGLLLTLNRWGDLFAPGLPSQALIGEIVPLAYGQTTTLGANLIECAAEGEVDERLSFALDGIVTGDSDPAEILRCLLDYGNSSGLDSLVGMAIALSGAPEDTHR